MEKKKITGLALLTIMIAMSMMISLAKAVTWVEVVRWSGSPTSERITEHILTEPFNCGHVEWRIRWNINWSYFDGSESIGAVLQIIIYEEGEEEPIGIIYREDFDRSGIKYIHNNNGTFYLDVLLIHVDEYIIIVEQDIASIPEFTPATLAIVLIAVSILVVASRQRNLKLESNPFFLFEVLRGGEKE